MDWRTWSKSTLDSAAPVTAIIPVGRIRGAGSTDTPQKRPFIEIRFGTENKPMPGVRQQFMTVWVHDDPGDYMRIDAVLVLVRAALEGQVKSVGAVSCLWLGNSGELADDGHKTITRNASFQLNGKDV